MLFFLMKEEADELSPNWKVRSNKHLWSLVANKVLLSSDSLLKDELAGEVTSFKELLLQYKPRKASQKGEKITRKISDILNIDISQGEDLLFLYLTSGFRGTVSSSEEIIKDEKKHGPFLMDLFQFYKSERQYLLQSLKCILKGTFSTNPRQDIFEDFLKKCYGPDGPKNLLLDQLAVLIDEEIPEPNFDSQLLTQEYQRLSAWYNLREISETLSLLNLALKKYTWNSKDFLKLFQISQKNGFGRRMPLRHLFDARCESLIETVGQLEFCILVQMMCLKPLVETMSSLDHPILIDSATIKEVEIMLSGMGTQKEHGPIMIGWLIMHSLGPLGDEALVKYRRLGQKAIDQRVLVTLGQAAKNISIQEISHPVIYDLLTSVICKFDPSTLGTHEDLYAVSEKVLSTPKIAEEFWSDGLETGLGQVVTEVALKYPAVSAPFLNLMNSLAGASADSCFKVVGLLNDFPGVASFLDEISPSHISRTDSGNYMLATNMEIYGHLKGRIVLRAGVEGQMIDKHFGREVVHWGGMIPAWKIFELQTEDLLFQLQQGMASVQPETINVVRSIIGLIVKILKFCPESYASLENFSELVLNVLDRFSLLPNVPNDLLAVCLQLVTTLLDQPKAREVVWHHLRQSRLFPHFLGLVQNPLEMVIHTEVNSALVGNILAGQECVIGSYPFTLAFLEFVLMAVKMDRFESEIVFPSLVFVLREIFPTHPKWRFDDLVERNRVADLCLEIFSTSVNSKDITVKTVTAASLLYGPAGYALLELIAIGDKVIQAAYESDPDFGSGPGAYLTSHIGKSLALLNRLFAVRTELKLAEQIKDATLAEKLLKAQPSGHSQPHLALTVAHYLYNRHMQTIPKSAIELLSCMASDFELSLLACFGTDGEAVTDILLRRLSYGTDDVQLKEAILRFMTVCVVRQPGLLQVLIDAGEPDKKPKADREKGTVLSVIRTHFKNYKDMNDISVSIFKASVEFACTLWAAGCIPAISALKEHKTFWNDVCHPLFAEKQDCGSLTSVLRLVSLDLFASQWRPDSELEALLRKLVSKDHLIRLLKNVLSMAHASKPSEDLDLTTVESGRASNSYEELLLLNAFRDLMIILMNPRSAVKVDESLIAAMIETTIESLRLSAEEREPEVIGAALTELLVMLFAKCKRKEDFTSCSESLSELLSEFSPSFLSLKPRFQINLLAAALRVTTASDTSGVIRTLSPVLTVFQSYVQRIPDFLQAEQPHLAFQKASLLLFALLRILVSKLRKDEASLNLLEQADVVPCALAVARLAIQVERGTEVCEAALTVLSTLAEIPRFATQLLNSNLGTSLWLPASTLPSGEVVKGPNDWSSNWNNVWRLLIGLCTILMNTHKFQAINEGLSLVGLGFERFAQFLLEGPSTINLKEMELAVAVLNLLYQLAKYKKEWKAQHRFSCEKIMPIVYRSIYRSVALLLRPSLLSALLDNRKFSSANVAKRRAVAFEVDLHPVSLSNLHRESVSEGGPPQTPSAADQTAAAEATKSPAYLEAQEVLLELVSHGIAVLSQLSPTLETVMVQVNYIPSKDDILLSTNLSTPALEEKEMDKISSGTLVAVATVCLRLLRDDALVASQTLFATLQLLLAQAKLLSDIGNISGEELQSFKRELGGELGLIDESIRRLTQRRTAVPVKNADKKVLSLLTGISKKLL